MNNQNLRSFNQMTPEERRAISSKGGKASAEARRKRREQVELCKAQMRAEEERKDDGIREIRETARLLRTALSRGITV